MFKLKLILIISGCCLFQQFLNAQPSEDTAYKDSAQHALYNAKDDTSRIKVLYALSIAYSDNDSANALKYANECLQSALQKKWQKGIGLAYRALGMVYYTLSDYSTSIQYYKKAYAIFKNLHDKNNSASLLSNIGNVYVSTGLYAQSLENYFAALKLFEETKNTNGISAAYSNIGIDYYNLLQYDKAIQSYSKSLQIDRNTNDKFDIASDLDNIAVVYIDEGKYDSANVNNLNAVLLFSLINDLPNLAKSYINRGNILLKQHHADSAYKYYSQALSINKKLNIAIEIASCYRSLGNLYLQTADNSTSKKNIPSFLQLSKIQLLTKAKNYLLEAVNLGKKVNDISRLMDYNLLLSTIEQQLGNYKNALGYHQQYTVYKDSIYNDDNRKKVEAMEQERLAEIKDQQIQILQQQKALNASEFKREALIKNIVLLSVIIIAVLVVVFIVLYNRRKKMQFDKQVMQVEMKALRTQMNPHFIFNSLHSINNYVMENDKQNASAYLLKFADLMRFILENSREQEVPVETDLQALELYMQLEALQSKKTFNYKIETDAQIDKANTLIPPMLLQPFVENAILHGIKYKEDGFIKIKVREENEMICFEIEDNGTGIKESTVNAQQNKKHKSLGRKIVDERLNIINHLHKAKASVQTFNLGNNDTADGVKVKLLLPLKFAF